MTMGKEATLHSHLLAQADNLRHKPWDLIKEVEAYANTKAHLMVFRQPKIAISRKALEELDPKPKVILEFGTYVGVSAIAWAQILKEINAEDSKGCKVYTFEINPECAKIARDLAKLAGVDDVLEVLEGSGEDSLRKLVQEGKVQKADMVFFDHWEDRYVPDLKVCEELNVLKEGGIVIADNTDMPGAPDYLKYVKAGGQGKVRYESTSHEAITQGHGPKIVEISKVISV